MDKKEAAKKFLKSLMPTIETYMIKELNKGYRFKEDNDDDYGIRMLKKALNMLVNEGVVTRNGDYYKLIDPKLNAFLEEKVFNIFYKTQILFYEKMGFSVEISDDGKKELFEIFMQYRNGELSYFEIDLLRDVTFLRSLKKIEK